MVRGMPMPAIKTITPQMRVDDTGNLWVETHEQKEEEAIVFTVYENFGFHIDPNLGLIMAIRIKKYHRL